MRLLRLNHLILALLVGVRFILSSGPALSELKDKPLKLRKHLIDVVHLDCVEVNDTRAPTLEVSAVASSMMPVGMIEFFLTA